MEMDIGDNPLIYEHYDQCPECGRMSFVHDEDKQQHICVDNECGIAIDEKDYDPNKSAEKKSVWAKIKGLFKK